MRTSVALVVLIFLVFGCARHARLVQMVETSLNSIQEISESQAEDSGNFSFVGSLYIRKKMKSPEAMRRSLKEETLKMGATHYVVTKIRAEPRTLADTALNPFVILVTVLDPNLVYYVGEGKAYR